MSANPKKCQSILTHAGADIVADSIPAAEYEKTLAKAAGFLAALNQPRMDTDEPSAAYGRNHSFGLQREAKRHAAFGSNRPYGKRCRRCALPPQSKSLSSVREVAGWYYGLPAVKSSG
jgi:hypothetical protein